MDFAGLGSAVASLMFVWAMVHQYFPSHFDSYLAKHGRKLLSIVYPYIQITIPEYTGDRMRRSDAYAAIEAYLTASCTLAASKLKVESVKHNKDVVLSMDANEEVADHFSNAKLWWSSSKTAAPSQVISFYPAPADRHCYKLTFHKRHRALVVKSYLAHVIGEGKAIGIRNRQRKLFTNNNRKYGKVWSHVMFEHPATFDTLAMDPDKKRDIMADLDAFRNGKDYYTQIGKAWKRGYLLHGPPGTGKSTMIAAIANYLNYDVYDLELTTVKTNTDLRKLLIEVTAKSIIVIEDIDCSLNLAGKRKQKTKPGSSDESSPLPPAPGEEKDEASKVTLSGLLNFVDGLWSACGGERLVVFTTNHVEKLDEALVRRGRMDMHIEMSFCTFEAFKVLAWNYLRVADHPLFDDVRVLMEVTRISPADVAEHLISKSGADDAGKYLKNLIAALTEFKVEEKRATSGQGQQDLGVVTNWLWGGVGV